MLVWSSMSMSLFSSFVDRVLGVFRSKANLAGPKQKKKALDEMWEMIMTGDHITVNLKDPKEVGIISVNHQPQTLSYQRLDKTDIETKKIVGYVISKGHIGETPVCIDYLKINVLKATKNSQKFVEYFLLKEEIESILAVD